MIRSLIRALGILIAIFIIFSTGWAAEETRPLIQIAILLDTSNSRDGLIAQAKTQLWKIVNELTTAKKDGQTPELQGEGKMGDYPSIKLNSAILTLTPFFTCLK
jgi:hypothetical protein